MKATGIDRANTATGEADMSISHRCTSAGIGGSNSPARPARQYSTASMVLTMPRFTAKITTDSGLEKYSPSVPTANGRKATKAR